MRMAGRSGLRVIRAVEGSGIACEVESHIGETGVGCRGATARGFSGRERRATGDGRWYVEEASWAETDSSTGWCQLRKRGSFE